MLRHGRLCLHQFMQQTFYYDSRVACECYKMNF